MPTYDYECTACGHTFDELQSFSDPPLTKCPKCKKNKLQRLFGGGGAIIFKGSGFYETDYRRPPEKSSDGEAAKPESKPETKTETKADSASAPANGTASTGSTTAPAGKSETKGGGKKKG